MKHIIDAAAKKGIEALSFTGGEPFLYSDEIIELIRYASSCGIPCIRTGTNGFMFMGSDNPEWEPKIRRLAHSLAETDLYTFWISLDSAVPEVHENMRGLPGVVDGIEKAIPIFHEYGIYPSANLGINRNIGSSWISPSDEKVPSSLDEFYMKFSRAYQDYLRFAIDLGFTTVNACYPMSVDSADSNLESVYGASSPDESVRFSSMEKSLMFRAMSEIIPLYRSSIRIFTPLSTLETLHAYHESFELNGYACPGGVDFFFIDAKNGDTYPCGFRGGENLGKIWDINMRSLKKKPWDCRLCEWECFRDPADLIGPLLDLSKNPFKWLSIKNLKSNRFHIWLSDMKYQIACGFFNGRKAPDYMAMEKFQTKERLEPVDNPILETLCSN